MPINPIRVTQQLKATVQPRKQETISVFDETKEFALSGKGLERVFVGQGTALAIKVHALFPSGVPTQQHAISAYTENSFTLTVEVNGKSTTFIAEKRSTGGGKATWALSANKKALFAKVIGLQEKDKIIEAPIFDESKEFSLSGIGLETRFVGSADILTAKLRSLFPVDVPTAPCAIRAYPRHTFTLSVSVDRGKFQRLHPKNEAQGEAKRPGYCRLLRKRVLLKLLDSKRGTRLLKRLFSMKPKSLRFPEGVLKEYLSGKVGL